MRLPLKLAIAASGKTQRQFAQECRTSESRFSRIVCGWTAASKDERCAIAEALSQPVEKLFGDELQDELHAGSCVASIQNAILHAQELAWEEVLGQLLNAKQSAIRKQHQTED